MLKICGAVRLLLIGGGIFFGLANWARAEDCYSPHYVFCENCDTSTTVTAPKNARCQFYMRERAGIDSVTIVRRPSHGFTGIEEVSRPREGKTTGQTHFIYVPERGYSGPDSFALRIAYFRRHGSSIQAPLRYETTVTYDVQVQ